MYESGTEFKITLTDFHCPSKKDGRCHHVKNIDKETGQSVKWCDISICPIKA